MARSDLLARVRAHLVAEPGLRVAPMFGGVSVFLDDAMVASVRANGDLLVRVAGDRHDELAARPGASWAVMGRGRRMGRGWLTVDADALDRDEDVAGWLDLAREHRRSVTPD